MTQDEKKRAAAAAAMALVEPDSVIGVGTGSTTRHFIELLATRRHELAGAVASSVETATLLHGAGIEVLELNDTGDLPLYVDGADEATTHRQLIKGGGGALTREKVLAAAAARFVCIVDDSKLVGVLGRHPLPVEVLPMARSFVARQLVRLGGTPQLRGGYLTDNGNVVLDVFDLVLTDPAAMESAINEIPGVVCNGLFARRPADLLLVAGEGGVRSLR